MVSSKELDTTPSPSLGIRKEQLLPPHSVSRDCVLSDRPQQPVNEGLTRLHVDVGVFERADQDHTILIGQHRTSFKKNLETSLIVKTDPATAVCQTIAAHSDRDVQRATHSRSGFSIPHPAGFPNRDTRRAPQCQFLLMGTRVIAP